MTMQDPGGESPEAAQRRTALSGRAVAGRATVGFLLGAFLGSFTFPHYGPLTVRSFVAGVVASGAFCALLAVIASAALPFARKESLSLSAIHSIAAFCGACAGAVWWLVAAPDVGFLLSLVIGALVGMVAIHG